MLWSNNQSLDFRIDQYVFTQLILLIWYLWISNLPLTEAEYIWRSGILEERKGLSVSCLHPEYGCQEAFSSSQRWWWWWWASASQGGCSCPSINNINNKGFKSRSFSFERSIAKDLLVIFCPKVYFVWSKEIGKLWSFLWFLLLPTIELSWRLVNSFFQSFSRFDLKFIIVCRILLFLFWIWVNIFIFFVWIRTCKLLFIVYTIIVQT